jgi:nitroimidazol reductase NimA-like FMN-containing flavoprotein (pyridoxamine 5'-phosphate oxidase superfamily)
MHETAEDLAQLQRLLDSSYEDAGPHLRRIITPERRLTADQLASTLTGMRLLVLATVSTEGRPVAGPVDGIFFRGRFYFGSSPDSVRMRHIARRPFVSATHLPAEELSVTVHGTATTIDVAQPDQAEFRRALLDIYVPRYGESWEAFLDSGVLYARIDAERMFTYHMAECRRPWGRRRSAGDGWRRWRCRAGRRRRARAAGSRGSSA